MYFTEMIGFVLNTAIAYFLLTVIFEQASTIGLIIAILYSFLIQGKRKREKNYESLAHGQLFEIDADESFPERHFDRFVSTTTTATTTTTTTSFESKLFYLSNKTELAASSVMATVLKYSSLLGGFAFFIVLIAGEFHY